MARTSDCLPSNTAVTLRFHRAPASFGVIKTSNTIECKQRDDEDQKKVINIKLDSDVIQLINPVLHAHYSYSHELNSMMSRISSTAMEIPFMDYAVRRSILSEGLSSYDINLLQGKLPKYIFFTFMGLDRMRGTDELSLTRFNRGELEEFNLMLDHESITGHPLKKQVSPVLEFYQNFLKMTNRYLNPWSSGVLSLTEFRNNFIIVANLEKLKIFDGALQLKLQFERELTEKLALIWLPVYEKRLIIDKNDEVIIE